LVAPYADTVDVDRAIKSDLLSRRQMLLSGEYQQLVLVQRMAKFVRGSGIWLRAVETGNRGAKGRVVDGLNEHCC
jgi:hypothetical protein